MLWSNSTSQVPALTKMRYRCVTDVTRFFTSDMSRVFHSWHLWIHTLYDTSVALWESWELSSWQDLSLALLEKWNFKRALRHFMVGNMRQNGIKWLHLTTHDICSSTLSSLYIYYIYLHINMLWGAKKVGWAFCLAMQWSDFACLMGPYMSMPWIERQVDFTASTTAPGRIGNPRVRLATKHFRAQSLISLSLT